MDDADSICLEINACYWIVQHDSTIVGKNRLDAYEAIENFAKIFSASKAEKEAGKQLDKQKNQQERLEKR